MVEQQAFEAMGDNDFAKAWQYKGIQKIQLS